MAVTGALSVLLPLTPFPISSPHPWQHGGHGPGCPRRRWAGSPGCRRAGLHGDLEAQPSRVARPCCQSHPRPELHPAEKGGWRLPPSGPGPKVEEWRARPAAAGPSRCGPVPCAPLTRACTVPMAAKSSRRARIARLHGGHRGRSRPQHGGGHDREPRPGSHWAEGREEAGRSWCCREASARETGTGDGGTSGCESQSSVSGSGVPLYGSSRRCWLLEVGLRGDKT